MSVPAKPFAWSHSALKNFETCPLKYYHQSIAKTYKDETSEAGNYGKDAHAAIQKRILPPYRDMPMGMRQYQSFVDMFREAPGDTYAEQKMAMNRKYQPVDYFASDVWVRGQVDAAKHNKQRIAVVDWKFGKIDTSWEDQGLIMAQLTFAQMAEVEVVSVAFVWWKEARDGIPPVSSETYTRENIGPKWLALMPRVQHMEEAVALTNFPANPNGLCRQYCPVMSCPHNGRR